MKTTMKKTAAYLLVMMLVFQILPVLAETSTVQGPITSYRDKLEINADYSIITVGMELQLSATTGYDSLIWSSDNEEIAVVDEFGDVTAISAGQVKITAAEDIYTDSITLRVIDDPNGNTDDSQQEKMIIIISVNKDKITYDGLEHQMTYNATSNNDAFDADHLILNNPDHLPTGRDGGVYQDELTADDFFYDGYDNVEFVISNGWLQIKPANVTVKADDVTLEAGETEPEFTATVIGLVDGDDPDLIQYTFETLDIDGITYINPVCEPSQGNYRVKAQAGILTIGEAPERSITVSSDWPVGEPAYAGTLITLTAELTGFENVDYTLQWQHSEDLTEWIDEPGANGISFTYELNRTTAKYSWRVVADY